MERKSASSWRAYVALLPVYRCRRFFASFSLFQPVLSISALCLHCVSTIKTIMMIKKVYGAEICVLMARLCGATFSLSLSPVFTFFLAIFVDQCTLFAPYNNQRTTERKSAPPWRVCVALLPVYHYRAIFAHSSPFWLIKVFFSRNTWSLQKIREIAAVSATFHLFRS